MEREVGDRDIDDVFLLMTLKCNAKCRHCYINAGPKRTESMDLEDMEYVVDQAVDSNVDRIVFTGGEPMLEKDKLLETVKYANNKKKETGYPKNIGLQTNAFWAINDKETKKVLRELTKAGVNEIQLDTDEFHKKFIPEDRPYRASQIAKKFMRKVYSHDYGKKRRIAPIGRAKTLPKKKQFPEDCYLSSMPHLANSVFINPMGEVYPCCWQVTKSMGNILETPLKEIVEKADEDPAFQKLYKTEGIKELADSLGIDSEYSKEKIEDIGECGYCEEVFRKYSEKLLEK
ncbi:MAG: radical SAM protein [Candidatus Aenigmarchaeota archaeon]|nr:radical SAM protein [Candidatus Aenigmarchaeota archaeon]